MPRPKGSMNKEKVAVPVEPVPFEYEKHGDDVNYHKVITGGEIPIVSHTEDYVVPLAMGGYNTTTLPYIPSEHQHQEIARNVLVVNNDLLFFVEGKVRLQTASNQNVVADQTRLVWAKDSDEAIKKFTDYYVNLSNEIERYSLVGAKISEAIK